MSVKIKIITTLLLLTCFKLSAQTDTLVNGKYISKLIGWSIDVPENWSLESAADREKLLKPLEKKGNVHFDNSTTIKLISFKKDDRPNPLFMSGAVNKAYLASVGVKTPEDFIGLSEMIIKRASPSVKINKKIGKMKIDKQEFTSYVYIREGSPVQQRGLITFRKGYLFYMTWIYDNDVDNEFIEKVVKSSTFE